MSNQSVKGLKSLTDASWACWNDKKTSWFSDLFTKTVHLQYSKEMHAFWPYHNVGMWKRLGKGTFSSLDLRAEPPCAMYMHISSLSALIPLPGIQSTLEFCLLRHSFQWVPCTCTSMVWAPFNVNWHRCMYMYIKLTPSSLLLSSFLRILTAS